MQQYTRNNTRSPDTRWPFSVKVLKGVNIQKGRNLRRN